MDAAIAYRACEQVTRARAGNFYYGIRLLPPEKRRALCSVYAFARRVDDIADGTAPAEEKRRRLGEVRESLTGTDPRSPDPVLAALGDARVRFPIALSAFGDLIDGVEMDVRGVRYHTVEELEVYCRRVAGSIGRLSVAVFGAANPVLAARLADDLGVAMQLTNILRDLGEDLAGGRCYLPTDVLRAFDCLPELRTADRTARSALVRAQVASTRSWFSRGLVLLGLLDRRSAACVAAMTGIYRRILDDIERDPEAVLRARVSLPPWEKAWVAAASLARPRAMRNGGVTVRREAHRGAGR